jgi:hypothetical protein
VLHNGQVLVVRDGVMYTVLGQKVQDWFAIIIDAF